MRVKTGNIILSLQKPMTNEVSIYVVGIETVSNAGTPSGRSLPLFVGGRGCSGAVTITHFPTQYRHLQSEVKSKNS